MEVMVWFFIEDFQQLSDGRSRVDTIGTRRFKVVQYGEKDGYATGKVEYVEDNIELSTDEIAEISSIANQVKAIVQQSGHSRHIYMQLGVIPSVDVNPTFPLNWFLIASDIFGIQLSQTTKYDFLFSDECRESKKKRLEKKKGGKQVRKFGPKSFESRFESGNVEFLKMGWMN